MPTFKQKRIIGNFKLRIQKKYENVSEETENISDLLQACLSQFKSRMLELSEKEDNDFYEQYRKLNEDLESYREKLFHVQTTIENILTEDAANEIYVDSLDKALNDSTLLAAQKSTLQGTSSKITDISELAVTVLNACSSSSNQINFTRQEDIVLENLTPVIQEDVNHSIINLTTDVKSNNLQTLCEDQEGSEKSFSHSSCYRSFSSNFSDIHFEETASNYSAQRSTKISQNCISNSETEHLSNKCMQKQSTLEVPLPIIAVPSTFSATLTHIVDPGNFWLQLENFNNLSFPLSDFIHEQPPSDIQDGVYCLAPFKSTSFYYRAKILNTGNLVEKIKVLFIDHGSTEDVSLCDIRPLPCAAYEIPMQAINCYLFGISPTGNSWSTESIQRFKEFQCFCLKTEVHFIVHNKYGVKLIANVSEEFTEDYSTDVTQSLYLDKLAILDGENYGSCNREWLSAVENPGFKKPCSKHVSYSENAALANTDNKISCDSGVSVTSTDKFSHVLESSNIYDSSHHSSLPLSASRETCDFYNNKINEYFSENNVKTNSSDLISFESDENIDISQNFESVEKLQVAESFYLDNDFSFNLTIPPAKVTFVEQNMMLIMFSHIISPSEFYVNMAMENILDLDDLREQMTSTYKSLTKTLPSIHVDNVVENMYCAACFQGDNCWYRVKVLRINFEDKERDEVLVQYLDWGNSEMIKIKNLYPLSHLFAKHPALAVKCCLVGCTPKKSRSGDRQSLEGDWDEQAIIVFKNLIRAERCFTAQLIQEVNNECNKALPVLLWDTEGVNDVLINSALASEGVADFDNTALSKSVQETCKNGNEIDMLSEWDPMSEEYHSIENSYGVPVEDLEVATLGYKAKDENYTCKYFALRGSCPRGSNCSYRHVPLTESGVTRDQEEVYSFDHIISVPEGARNVLIKVTSVITPGYFYATFPFGPKDVDDIDSLIFRGSSSQGFENREAEYLFFAMNKHYSEASFDENTTVALPYGNIVAAKCKFDNNWHRGRIIDIHDIAGPATIFFVDFGHKELVPRKLIRKILPQFVHTPFQAVECSLADVVPYDFLNGKLWSLEAINFFKDCVAQEILLAEIKHRCGHVLNVTLRKTSEYDHDSISELLVAQNYAQFQNFKQSLKQESLFVPG